MMLGYEWCTGQFPGVCTLFLSKRANVISSTCFVKQLFIFLGHCFFLSFSIQRLSCEVFRLVRDHVAHRRQLLSLDINNSGTYIWKRCSKKNVVTMWTSQIYGHHDKMARTKTHRTLQNTEYTKTQQTLRNNYFLCFSDFSGFFYIFNFQ